MVKKRGQRGAPKAGARKPAAPKAGHRSGPQKQQKPKPQPTPPASAPEEPRTFRLGAVAGATPGKWIDTWHERMPHVPLELVPMDATDPAYPSLDGVDAAIVRLPLNREDAHAIPLYDEVAVVVMSTESALSVTDELTFDDLAGEVLIVPADDVLGPLEIPGAVAPRFDTPRDTADAIEIVASGVGVAVVPMSLARLHHRKDVAFRPLAGAPASAVALAWIAERTTPDVETFIGIVRGRTAHSSRG